MGITFNNHLNILFFLNLANSIQAHGATHENCSNTYIYTIPIQQSTLPSYSEVVIEDPPTYEEINRTKAELNRS